ncbi:MAG: C-type lectin domain-containing protein [Kofleriaceae bacterium]
MTGWSATVSLCSTYGMELASIDDADEYTSDTSSPTPYWYSLQYTDDGLENLDGCTPYTMFAPGEPATMALSTCAYRDTDGMHVIPCETPTINVGGLCETPRPNQTCAQAASTYTTSDDHNKADAAAACSATGGHLVEINTSAELQKVLDAEPSVNSFWVAATYSGTSTSGAFVSPTGCPEVFVWSTGEPMHVAANTCVVYTRGSGMAMRACTDTASTICEKN